MTPGVAGLVRRMMATTAMLTFIGPTCTLRAQSAGAGGASLDAHRPWRVSVLASAGASAWSQPVLASRLSSRSAGAVGAAIARDVSGWRAELFVDRATRGARSPSWTLDTRYTEVGALAIRRLFPWGPVSFALGGGPLMAWPTTARGNFAGGGTRTSIALDPSPQEYSARLLLEARTRARMPLRGRITFQRGFNRILRANPLTAEGRWDGTTPPYSKLLAFELGATVVRW